MPKNDTVERLAGGIAEDFGALFAAILGHAERLTDDLSPGDPRAASVHAIRRAAEEASSLTRQLLAFSRTQTLRPTIVDVNAAIARAKHGMQRVLGNRVSLETVPSTRVWPVRADVNQLDQVLHQLAVNARGAMPDGGSLVIATSNVRVAADDPRCREMNPGDYVELSVTDSGAGIGSSGQQHLFEPFFPAMQRPKASGLGLAMVYGAVKQGGGHIAVDSPVTDGGRGSRFRVFLPAADRQIATAVDADDAPTVLLFGDEPSVQSFIGDVLKRRGYRVVVAKDAWDALRVAEQHDRRIDLLIASGADGALVADAAVERRPSMHVLHVSASVEDAPQDRAGRSGRVTLAQPFTPATLARKVRAVLEVYATV